ncbi:MAG: Trigger factor [Chlamydiales bacterium]|jgi:trigger factor|nr:Trigger factor [Chlamydiales bacterium]
MQNYSKDGMHVEVQPQPYCRHQIKVRFEPEALKTPQKEAIKAINKQVSIPGFRKNKAPDALILSHYPTYVEQELKDNILQVGIVESTKLAGLRLMHQSQVKKAKVINFSMEKGAEIEFECEIFAPIPKIELENLELKNIEVKPVSEKDFQDKLEERLIQFAETIEITDRPVQEGDYVSVEIKDLDFDQVVCTNETFKVGAGRMADWVHRSIIGKNLNESYEVANELDPEADQEIKEIFRPSLCRVTVQAIRSYKWPELTEEFVSKFGAKNDEEFKERIRQSLQNEAESVKNKKLESVLMDYLNAKYSFDLPYSLIQERQKEPLQEMLQMISPKLSVEEKEQQRKQLEERSWNQAMKYVKTSLLLQQLVHDAKLEVAKEEVNSVFNEQLMRYRFLYPEQYEALTKDSLIGIYENIKESLMMKKAVDHVLNKAKLV